MCGIVATMRFDGRRIEQRDIERMRDTMYHRGPDGAGCYIDGAVGLGLRRLAIIDLSEAGHQPMSNEDGTVWLVFNGEIYNYAELRTELIGRGHRFSSHTDTEVIVHLYEELGEECVHRLRGMFAFVVWDSRNNLLFGARDRLGIKPFHYFADSNQFVCASDVKSILASPGVPCAVNREAIGDYLFSGFPLDNRSMFEGIRRLPPGHAITVRGDGVQVRKYWDVEYAYDETRSDAAVCDQLTSLLDDSVHVHCRSDAALGCHLSGGLDSSIVTALAARHRPSMKTFSIRFGEGGWYDETAFAHAAADYSGAEYTEAVPNGRDFAHLLPGLIWHMEMPLPNLGGFSYYTVSRLASDHVKVALTGHGGDEVFAGYPAQFQTAFGTTPFSDGAPDPHAVHNSMRPTDPHLRALNFVRRISKMGMRGVGHRLKHRFRVRPRTLEECGCRCMRRKCRSETRCSAGGSSRSSTGIRRFRPISRRSRAPDRPAAGPVSLSRSTVLSAWASPYGRSDEHVCIGGIACAVARSPHCRVHGDCSAASEGPTDATQGASARGGSGIDSRK